MSSHPTNLNRSRAFGVPATRRRFVGLLGALAAVPLLTACGSDDDDNDQDTSDTTTDRPTDAPGILSLAAARVESLESVRFTLAVDGTTFIDDGRTIQLLNAAGNVVRPDRVQATFQAMLEGTLTAEIRIITVGDDTWMTDLITGDWIPAFDEIGYNPVILFDAEHGLGQVMRKVENPELVGQEDVDGQRTDHIRATVAQEVVKEVTAGGMHSDVIDIEAWIAQDDDDLIRLKVAERPNPETDDPATWTLTLSRHNEPVTIEPPI